MEGLAKAYSQIASFNVTHSVINIFKVMSDLIVNLWEEESDEGIKFLVSSQMKISRFLRNVDDKSEVYFGLLETLVQHVICKAQKLFNNKLYVKCKHMIGECQEISSTLKNIANRSKNLGQLSAAEDCKQQMNTIKRNAACLQNVNLCKYTLKDDESKEGIQRALALLTEADEICSEQDIQVKAEILSWVGHVHWHYLQQSNQAQWVFDKMMLICSTLFVDNQSWYQRAQKDMQAIQELRYPSTKVRDVSKEIYEIQSMGNRGSHKFLDYIYRTYPPNTATKKVTSYFLTEQLRQAKLHYHPDTTKDPNLQKIYRQIMMVLNRNS
eukprot:TRINITY_DN15731_c0_g3_i2.p1 TRINITY_DN15731_c0_g3~~TRINITY_DN15731_c0_g3_i2.p1  ORF type:complete len:325 (+),score=13.14 TRINITY_DN15731_c0_g3_i2:506-1480(+)